MSIELHVCPHGYHHPASPADLDYPHSCDGCWCEGWRDQGYGWNHSTEPTA